MTTMTGRAAAGGMSPAAMRQFLEDVLDDMPLTERPYHHLHYSLPLVASIVERAQHAAEAGDRVLLIGGNALLANALIHNSQNLDIWQFPNAFTPDDLKTRLTREITPATLGEADIPEGAYRLIIVPLVLESLQGEAVDFLRRLRKGLAADGTLILATKNQSRLDARLAAIAGTPIQRTARRLSLSWPDLPVVREYHPDELVNAGRRAGFRVRRPAYVSSTRLFMELDNFSVGPYATRKSADLVHRMVPSTRDTVVLVLSPRVPHRTGWRTGDGVFVSVIVSALKGGEQLRAVLACLRAQTYPPDLYEVIVIHDGGRADVLQAIEDLQSAAPFAVRDLVDDAVEGPRPRNLAMSQARGDVCAHTDDSSELPPDWIEAGVRQFDEDAAVVAGPIFATGGSHPRFLEVPGLRPEPAEGDAWRDDLFPISNVFYRTAVALSAGGFRTVLAENGSRPAIGWDAELPWRLQRHGWHSRFREEVRTFRRFPGPHGSWIKDQMRKAAELPGMYKAVPELVGNSPKAGPFASRQTMYFDLMLAGAALAVTRRRWPWLLLSLPWLSAISKRLDFFPPSAWKQSARMVAKMGVLQGAWLAGLVRGSIKARRPLL